MLASVSAIFVGLVAAEHFYFLILEMFLWTKPKGRKAFGLTEEFAKSTATLAANQGLYNGFLAAGLVWSFFVENEMSFSLRVFFLSCVVIAGVYGGVTVNKKIAILQAIPAALALVFIFLGR